MEFLRKLFAKKEPELKRNLVKIEEAGEWLDSYMEETFEDVRYRIEDIFNSKRALIKNLKVNLDSLKSAKLRNSNIHPREFQLMEGNRDAFIMKHNLFMENMIFPEDVSFVSSLGFCTDMKENLENLKKTTAKSTAIMNEFFSDNVSKINKNMHSFEMKTFKILDMINANDDRLDMINNVRQLIIDFHNAGKLNEHLAKEMKVEDRKLLEGEAEIASLKKKIAEKKSSEEYIELSALDKEKVKLNNVLREKESELRNIFSKFDKALKKFKRQSLDGEALIDRYLANPADALAKDESMRVSGMLSSMADAVERGGLDIKEKMKEKVVQSIRSVDKTYLESFRNSYVNLKSQKDEISRRFSNSDVMRDIDECEYKMTHVEEMIDRVKKDSALIKDKMEKNDLSIKKKDLEHELSSITASKVRLVE